MCSRANDKGKGFTHPENASESELNHNGYKDLVEKRLTSYNPYSDVL